ncbi:MAG: mycofactocin biosynthesis peptidyl-dipeptidase MftE [Acidimicrobiales bacterium]
MTRLDGLTWPEVADRAATSVLVVPIGSTEQHGPHLPLATDLLIAVALAERLARLRPDVLVAPGLPYGSSGEHAGFAGTLSIGQDALEALVVELVRSADAFAGVVLVSAHGGNAEPLERAAATLEAEGRNILSWAPRVDAGDAHAGRTETSILLALGERVVRERAAAGDTRPLNALLPALRRDGVAALSANGVLGDPAGASASEGAELLDALTTDLVAAVAAWRRRL